MSALEGSMIYVLKPGDVGQEVRRLQDCLLVHVSGTYDSATEQAVRDLQTANGLVVDGQAGPQVLGHLGIYPHLGVDLSHYNTVLSWTELAAERPFIFFKATEGVNNYDPTFWKNLENARNYKVKVVGAYHFAHLIEDPIKNAAHFLDLFAEGQAKGLISGRPVLDLESGGASMSVASVQQWALAWLTEVEAKCKTRPLLYTYLPFLMDRLGGGGPLTAYDLWCARYRGGRVVDPVGGNLTIGDFKTWLVYQYSAGDDGKRVAGMGVGKVDQNLLAGGDLNALRGCIPDVQ